jgi:hypothetical protein
VRRHCFQQENHHGCNMGSDASAPRDRAEKVECNKLRPESTDNCMRCMLAAGERGALVNSWTVEQNENDVRLTADKNAGPNGYVSTEAA